MKKKKKGEGRKGGRREGEGEEGREDKPIKSTRNVIISPAGSSVTASKSEYIRECPWLCPFNLIHLCGNRQQKTEESLQEKLFGEEK